MAVSTQNNFKFQWALGYLTLLVLMSINLRSYHKHIHTLSSNIHKQNIIAVLISVSRLHAVSEFRLTEKFLE